MFTAAIESFDPLDGPVSLVTLNVALKVVVVLRKTKSDSKEIGLTNFRLSDVPGSGGLGPTKIVSRG